MDGDGLESVDDENETKCKCDDDESEESDARVLGKKSYFGNRPQTPEGPHILEPDHPLLIKFQSTLKAHLEKQYNRLCDETHEMEIAIKKQDLNRETIGVALYDLQREVSKQQATLDDYLKALTEISELRENLEERVKEERQEHKKLSDALIETENEEKQLRAEFDETSRLEQQLSEWEKSILNELAINQRMADKDRVQKAKLAQEKRYLDLLLFNITNEVRRLESEKCMLEIQHSSVDDTLNVLRQSSADANADLQALHTEHTRLLHLWGEVVIQIQQRDKVLMKLRNDNLSAREKLKNSDNAMNVIKKLTTKEMEENETLTNIKSRMEYDLSNLERQVQFEENTDDKLLKKLNELELAFQQTEKDLFQTNQEYDALNLFTLKLQKEMEKVTNEKKTIEEKILQLIEDQITNDKASKHLARKLQERQAISRNSEMAMNTAENNIARMSNEAERVRTVIAHLDIQLAELVVEFDAADKYVNEIIEQLAVNDTQIEKKARVIDILNKKLEKLAAGASTGQVTSPLDEKIQALEKNIIEAEAETQEQESFWLRLQGHSVNVSKRRSDQLKELHLLRKQIFLVDHQNRCLSKDLDTQLKEENNVIKRMDLLSKKLDSLSGQLCKKRGYQQEAYEATEFAHIEMQGMLKEAEIHCASLETELEELSQEIDNLEEMLMSKQRDALAWDGKVRLVSDTVREIKEASASTGDVGGMRAEIHRMQVRLGQLRKAQEKLIQDMEHCISRRDIIVESAESRDKRGDASKSRMRILAKIVTYQKKIKTIKKEITATEHTVKEMSEQQNLFLQDLEVVRDALQQMEEEDTLLQQEINNAAGLKMKNKYLIIRKQARAKKVSQITDHYIEQLSLRAETVAMTLGRQKNINCHLLEVVQLLRADFPSHEQSIDTIYQILQQRD